MSIRDAEQARQIRQQTQREKSEVRKPRPDRTPCTAPSSSCCTQPKRIIRIWRMKEHHISSLDSELANPECLPRSNPPHPKATGRRA